MNTAMLYAHNDTPTSTIYMEVRLLSLEKRMASQHANENKVSHVGFEVLTVVVMKSSIFRDTRIMPQSLCSPYFAYCLLHAGFFFGLLFSLEERGDVFFRNID
jgi:hypothetical protein